MEKRGFEEEFWKTARKLGPKLAGKGAAKGAAWALEEAYKARMKSKAGDVFDD